MNEHRKSALFAAASFVAGIALLVGCTGDDDELTFEDVVDECGPGSPHLTTRDGGTTLIVDHRGDDDLTGASLEQVACVLWLLEPPSAVTAHMESTRALDGRQSAEWPGYEASWTFHPDTGLDVIITTD